MKKSFGLIPVACAVLAAAVLPGCSGSDNPAADVTDVAGTDSGPDVAGDSATHPDQVTADSREDAASEVQQDADGDLPDSVSGDVQPDIYYPPVEPPLPFGPENRGYVEKRGIVHLHSRWSHDGCYPDHEEITSADIVACETTYQDATQIQQCKDAIIESMLNGCVDEYRDAICSDGIDFVFQTDHPSDARHQTFEDALHHRPDSGDVMVKDSQDRPVANKVTCGEGEEAGKFFLYFGTEGSKQMPIGMAGPVPDIVFNTSFDIYSDLEAAKAAIQVIHDLGGWALACHTEAGDIDAQRIVDLPLDIMEIFNFHPALMDIIANFDVFMLLDRFMDPSSEAPNPDLSVMLVMQPVENDPKRFDIAAKEIRLSHILATDIHRNVEIPVLCESAETCGDNWINTHPNMAHLLATGGPAILGDGERMDSYRRTLRWASNHALIEKDDTDYLAIRDAVGKGRSYSAFDVIGMPKDFDFFAVQDGAAVEMGEEVTLTPGTKVFIRTPTVSKPSWAGSRFGDPEDADIVTRLIRVNESEGSTVVAEIIGQGWTYEYAVDEPAVFRIEVWMTPKHLRADLADLGSLADKQYPWIYSNALFFR